MARGLDSLRQRTGNRNDKISTQLPLVMSSSLPREHEKSQLSGGAFSLANPAVSVDDDDDDDVDDVINDIEANKEENGRRVRRRRQEQHWSPWPPWLSLSQQRRHRRKRKKARLRQRQFLRSAKAAAKFGGMLIFVTLLFLRWNKNDTLSSSPILIMRQKEEQHPVSVFYCASDPTVKGVLNDDYCDCPDGSDEPLTSACSRELVGKPSFVCGGGTSAITIFASRVRDGVVDCPDGSDEK